MNRIVDTLRPFVLPVALIALASGILLVTDTSVQRSGTGTTQQRMPRVAILQHASQFALEEGVGGMIKGLAEQGYVDGRTVSIERFNAQGDMPTSNDIARRVTDGSFDLVLTSSTTSMQAVANANRQGKVKHIFGITADPAGAGIGVSRTDPLDHPPWMAGLGSFAPVEKVLLLAREMNPQLKRIGLVWHTAESNSQSYTLATREACRKLGLELLEANAENSSGVGEAARSLVARGIDALLVTGDVVVLTAIDSVVAAGKRGGIPVISVVPPNVRAGALFDLGGDFVAIGREVGLLAGEVLKGRSPATIPVVNRVPEQLLLNLVTLEANKAHWSLPQGLRERASVIIDATGQHANPQAVYSQDGSTAPPPPPAPAPAPTTGTTPVGAPAR